MPNKKVLVVTYYWYPFADVGTYRISRFCKYLARRGWEIVVLTSKKASAGLEGIPDDPIFDKIKVYRADIIEPTELLNIGKKTKTKTSNPGVFYQKDKNWISKLAVWLRLNVMLPDAKFTWKWFAVPLGKKIIKSEKPALILSTSPPPTTSLIAKELAQWSNIPWLADFRDPWTNIYYYDDNPQSKWAQKKNKKLELSALESADKITMVNHGFFPDQESIIKDKAKKIPNGFDPDHKVQAIEKPDKANTFTIRYFGSLKANQHPGAFITALQNIDTKYPDIANKISFEFYGSIDPAIRDEFLTINNNITTEFYGFISHDEMMKLVLSSQLLLLAIGRTKNSKFALSTKVFEYMISGNPVLGVGPTDGAASKLVAETKIGSFFERNDEHGIENYLLSVFKAYQNGTKSITPNEAAIDKYSFEHLTKELESIMLSMLD